MANGTMTPNRNAYGDELRRRRESKGWTQTELGVRAALSRSHIAHIEAGRRYPAPADADRLDQVLETGGIFRRFLPDKKIAPFFEGVAQLEPLAAMIRQYTVQLVPGLLQTESYTRAVFGSFFPRTTEEQCAASVRTRMDRAKILENPVSPEMWTMLDEAVLHRPVGGPAVMAEQLRHVLALAEKRIRVHVLPFNAGAHALLESSLSLLRFEDMPPLAYVEGLNTGTLMDDPVMVEHALTSYDLTLGDALSHDDSVARIWAAAEEYDRHARR